MYLSYTDKIYINGFRLQISRSIDGYREYDAEIIKVINQAKMYSENRISVYDVDRENYASVICVATRGKAILPRLIEDTLPQEREMKELLDILSSCF